MNRISQNPPRNAKLYHNAVTLVTLFVWIAFLSFTLSPTAVQAQQPELTIADMRVSIWPEYDDPRLLIIYRGRFDDATTFPRTVTFPIPRGAEVNAAAYAGETGELFTAGWQARQEGDFQLISFDLPVPAFQLEFYYDAIRSANGRQNGVLHAIQGTTGKHFTVTFHPPYPVQSLRFDVQQPLKASDLQMDPPPTEMTSDASGFRYAIYDYGSVARNQTIELHGSYVKANTETSVPPRRSSKEPSTPAEIPAVTAASSRQPLLLGAAVLLFGIAVASGILWMRGTPLPRWHRTSPPAKAPAPAAFCTQCGARLGQGDRFCRQCGAPVSDRRTTGRRQRRSRKGRQR